MFFIFGFGRQKRKDYGQVQAQVCPNCHNNSFGHLSKITKWFTLFFIPLIPYKTIYLKYCPICNYGERMTKGSFYTRQQQ